MMKDEKMNPLLSVIVPIYNVQDYLNRCLDSVCNQSYRNLEIICVDDGSEDSSGAILKKYSKNDCRVKIIHKQREGIVSARKTGVLAAKGSYITYVDADDWIAHEMYRDLMKVIIETKADLVTSGCIRDYGTHIVQEDEGIKPGIYDGKEVIESVLKQMISVDHFFKSNISMHLFNKIYRRDLLEECQLAVNNSINVGEDAACIYPYLLKSKKIVVTGKRYYHYCIRKNSTMGEKRKDEVERLKIQFRYLYNVGKDYTCFIPNIISQFMYLFCYELLLQSPGKIIKYENNFLFPFGQVSKNDRVVLYGQGKFGQVLKKELQLYLNVIEWIDKIDSNTMRILQSDKCDKIVIAAVNYDVINDMKCTLVKLGVDERKVLQIRSDYIDKNLSSIMDII